MDDALSSRNLHKERDIFYSLNSHLQHIYIYTDYTLIQYQIFIATFKVLFVCKILTVRTRTMDIRILCQNLYYEYSKHDMCVIILEKKKNYFFEP